MTMFVNLHDLPAGQAMYTVYVTTDPGPVTVDIQVDEYDVTARRTASAAQVAEAARTDEMFARLYGAEARIVGIVDQSADYILFDGTDRGEAL